MEQAGIYLHIPFCRQKCPYCDFYSIPYDDTMAKAYVQTLIRAMKHNPFRNMKADTLYLGGGTPTLLQPEQLRQLLKTAEAAFDMDLQEAEISMEANPGTVSRDALCQFRQAGVNRISFGVQSLIPQELAALGRSHTAEQAYQSIQDAQGAGFDHISADLMLAIPGQTEESLAETVAQLNRLPVSHVSAYLLKIEPDTKFGRNGIGMPCPDEDTAADLYLLCVDLLRKYGFEQYEISNFATSGMECRHNLKYWTGAPYLGLGSAAHSFIADKRYRFPRNLHSFLSAKNPFDLLCEDDCGGGFEEYAMLRLRLSEGLDLAEAETRFDVDASGILKKAKDPRMANLLKISNSTVSLTPEGFLLQNAVTAYLLF